ncbi:hypothetical protein [Candidatus Mycoplasma mahonii]|uniref:hypothetical protein n=1 Tax=Candidatus Mycoplasma mahonii TaxID=3004105 RepID=UPI0026F0A754|nr:hypothetical protein [Candidatus Mycoplasma mahonii]WKX02343.1 hypothetical protein O3I44_02975 [Candidatus Mycoplasma mahonii]
MKKKIKIVSGIGIGAVIATAIVGPLSKVNNNNDGVYITPGKKLVDDKIIESREYNTFKETFQDLKLGLTNINVIDIRDDGDNLVLTATGVLPRATVSTHASFIVQSAAAIQANPNTIIKAIFNVVKTTGEVTLLKLESGSKESEAVIKAAITKNKELNTTAMEEPTARMTDRITNPNKLTPEDKLSRATAFERYFDSLPVTTFNEGVTAADDKAIYDQIKTDGVLSINASSNIYEMNSLFNAEGDTGSLKVAADEGLIIYNNAITLANTTAQEIATKKANDQRYLNAEQTRVNNLVSNRATAKSVDAVAQGAFDNDAQSKYGITLGSSTEGAFTYTYDATAKTITITAVLIGGAGDLTIPLPTPIGLSPTPAENTEIETAANLLVVQTTAKGFIRTAFETAPSQDNAAHDAKLFGAIALAKTAADRAINDAPNEAAVNVLASSAIVGSEVAKVLAAIREYEGSTGTDKALADAKTTAKGFITTAFETAPEQDDKAHNAELFVAIANAKTAADVAIDGALDEAAVNVLASSAIVGSEVDKVLAAIELYKESTGTDKALADAKTKAKEFIATAVATAPSQDDKAHNAELFGAIANAKTAADVAIDGALDEAAVNVLASSAIVGSEVDKVLAAIELYKESTGTDKALADAKTKAKEFIATAVATAPSQDDKAHNAELFGAIANAKTAADVAIDGALDEAAVNVLASSAIVGSEVDKVLAAIELYKESTGTDKALADAKTASRNAFTTYFNALTTTSLEGDAVDPLIAKGTYENIKTGGLNSIDNAMSINDLNSLFNAEGDVGSLRDGADEGLVTYNKAIALANKKANDQRHLNAEQTRVNRLVSSEAIAKIADAVGSGAFDNDAQSKYGITLGNAADGAFTYTYVATATTITITADLIDGASDLTIPQPEPIVLSPTPAKNTETAIAAAKTTAKGFITTAFETAPSQDDKAHNAELFAAIANAKAAADVAIDGALNEAAVNVLASSETVGLEVDKVLEAITKYEESTGTDKALADAKTASRNAFTTYFNALTTTSLEGDAVDPLIAKGTYENIKTDGLNSIDNAMSINDLNSLFNAEGDVGSLRDGADEGLVTYNKAIALANKKANDQRHLNAEQTRVNRLVSSEAIAKIADAVGSGAFDNDAQSKYGITLGNAADGAFTYTYDATGTTITITADLIDGASDLTIPQPEPIGLSPTPAENTETAIATAKTTAKGFITTAFETAPEQDDKAHNAELFAAIANAKAAADVAIDGALNEAAVNVLASSPTIGTEVGNVLEAIKEYEESTGTDKALADAKTKAKEFIATAFATAPEQDDKAHNAELFVAIANAKAAADRAIDEALDEAAVNILASSETVGLEVDKVLEAITKYKESTGTDKALADAKTASRNAFTTYFNALTTTSLEGDAVDPLIAKGTYENIKTDGLNSIDNAMSINDLNSLFNAEGDVGSLRDGADEGLVTYNKAIALANKKANDQRHLNAEQTRVNRLVSSEAIAKIADAVGSGAFDNDAQSKYGITLGNAADGAFTYTYVATATTITITADLIDGASDLTIPQPEPIVLSPTPAKNTETAIAAAKTTAKGFITTAFETAPSQDDKAHNAELFAAIANAKAAADVAIDGALNEAAVNVLASSETVGLEVDKVLEAITKYKESTGTDKALADAKTASRNAFTTYFNALTTTSLEGDAVDPLIAKGTYENIKTDGLNSIDNAMSINDLNSLFNAEGDVGSLRDGADEGLVTYNKAIALANKKANDQRHLNAEQTRVNRLVSSEAIAKIADAVGSGAFDNDAQSKYGITLGNAADGAFTYTYVATATTITITADLIDGASDLTIPQPEPIVLSPTPAKNTETAIAAAKTTAKGFITTAFETAPSQDDKAHNAELFAAIANAKAAADVAIDGALNEAAVNVLASSPTIGTEVGNVLEAIKEYEESTGTDKALADAKTKAKEFIATAFATAPEQDDKAHNVELFVAIANAKAAADRAIDEALDEAAVNILASSETVGLEVDKVLEAITKYKESTGTDKALADAKTASRNAFTTYFNALTTTSLEGDAVDPLIAKGTYENIKTDGLNSIDNAMSINDLNSLFNAEGDVGSLRDGADEGLVTYNKAIALANKKANDQRHLNAEQTRVNRLVSSEAIAKIADAVGSGAFDNDAQSKYGITLGNAADGAFTYTYVATATTITITADLIDGASDLTIPQPEPIVLSPTPAKNTETAIAAAKTTAKGFITTAFETAPSQDDKAHNAELFAAIANAKAAADVAIDGALNEAAVNVLASSETVGLEVDKVLEAITKYKESTGTDKALADAKTASRNAFTTYFNALTTTSLEGDAVDPLIAKGTYENIKTDGLNSIDNAMSINDLNSLFNAEGDVGSLRDGADEGLVTYNKAIALANKKANDQRHLNAEQTRVNRLVSSEAIAKIADAVGSGPFDNDAQSKYGITLGSATEGAFTYTYDATGTTITITADLIDGASDLTIPQPEPIDLSPTPAENTETAIATAKTTAKGFITTAFETAPEQDDKAHNAELFAAIANAKAAADVAIDGALNEAAVNVLASSPTIGTEVGNVLEAIKEYEESTGTDKALADAKTKAKEFIATAFATAPEQDDKTHNAELFVAIANAKAVADVAIDTATNINAINVLASSPTIGTEVDKVLEAITKYKESTGTDKALADAKTTAKGFITTAFETAPEQDDKAHNAELFVAIANAKAAADVAIDTATNINAINVLASSPTIGTEVDKVLEAITKYKESTGTDKALADAKTKAKEFIATAFETAPEQDDKAHNAELFAAIASAQTEADRAIDGALNEAAVNVLASSETVGLEVDKVLEAITKYKESTGTDKALADAKTASRNAFTTYFNALTTTSLEGDAVDPLIAKGTYENIKTDGLNSIDNAMSINDLNSLFNAEGDVGSLRDGADEGLVTYNKAIALANKKANDQRHLNAEQTRVNRLVSSEAIAKIADAVGSGAFDNDAQSKYGITLGNAADGAFTYTYVATATTITITADLIDGASDLTIPQPEPIVLSPTPAKNTETAIAAAKTTAKGFITTAFETAPEQDDKAHNAELFAAIANAKAAADVAIDGALNEAAVNVLASSETVGLEVDKVLEAITKYKESTGTDKALADAKTASRNAFTTYFNALTTTSLEGDAVDPLIAKGTYENIKTDGLNSIDNAMSINDLNSLFNAEGDVGSLRDGADEGLVTYNKAIALANKKANDQRHLNAEQTRVNRLVSSEAIAKIADAVGSGAFDNDAQSKYGITLGNAADGAFTYTYVATATTITITADLIDGASDLTIPQPEPIVLSPTPAKNTETAIAAAKTTAKGFITTAFETAPSQDDKAHNAELFAAIANAKAAADVAIDGALNEAAVNVLASSPTIGTEVGNVLEAIKEYEESTGTDKALADAKTKAKEFIATAFATAPEQDDKAHNAELFVAIANAKAAADRAIDEALDEAAVNILASSETVGLEVDKVLEAITKYKESTGTDKALADAKTASRNAFTTYFNALTTTSLEGDAVDPLIAKGTYENIKTDGLNSIDNAMSINDLNSLFNAEGDVGSLRDGADEGLVTYNKAIALANKKANDQRHLNAEQTRVNRLVSSEAIAKIADAVGSGAFDNDAQSKYGITLGNAADGAFTYTYVATATTITITADLIDGASDLTIPQPEPIVLSPTPAKNTETAIAAAKTTAKGFITTAFETAPSQDDKAHNAELFAAIANAKAAADVAIDGALNEAAVNVLASSETVGLEVDKVLEAITKYKESTGTDKALADAKTASRNAFTTYFNALTTTSLEGDAVDPLIAKGTYENIKTDGLNSIDNAMSINDLNSLFNAEGDVGSLRDGADEGLVTYNKAIALANKKANDQRHLNAEQTRVNRLVSSEAIAKIADAVGSGPFDNDAQSKYGITLGSATEGAFTYTYDATGTTITITADLIDGASDLTIPQPEPIDLSPTPAENTETAIATAKTTAKGFITTAFETAPEQDDKAHNAELFAAIANAKAAADVAIDGALNEAAVNVLASSPTIGTEVGNVLEAIKEYEESTGTDKALADAKTKAKEFIATAFATAPEQDDKTHNAELFVAIANAKAVADVAIDTATNINAINVLASSPTIGTEVDKVLEAITKYKESTGTDKALADAKTTAKGFITTAFETAPEQDDKAHNAELFVAIANAKAAADVAIDTATNINAINVLASSPTIGTEVDKVLEAITKYKESTGTDKALADAKTKAKEFIATAFETAPEQDDKAHNAELFAAIASAQTEADRAIDGALNEAAVNVLASSETVGLEVDKVLEAITKYKESTGTDKALADAKTASRNAFTTYFNALTTTSLEGDAVDPLIAKGTYENIKTDGLNSIDNAMSINDLNSLFNAEGDVGSLRDGADEGLVTYNKAIALANKKANDQRHLNAEQTRVNRLVSSEAIAKIADAVGSGPFDNDAQSKYGITLGSATEGAFTYTYDATGTTITITADLIDGASDLTIPQPEPIDLSPTPAENTETAIATAKTTAKGFITTAFETAPEQDDKAHNAELFAAIANAKAAADVAIDGALDEVAINVLASSPTIGTEVDKVLEAIRLYEESIETNPPKKQQLPVPKVTIASVDETVAPIASDNLIDDSDSSFIRNGEIIKPTSDDFTYVLQPNVDTQIVHIANLFSSLITDTDGNIIEGVKIVFKEKLDNGKTPTFTEGDRPEAHNGDSITIKIPKIPEKNKKRTIIITVTDSAPTPTTESSSTNAQDIYTPQASG